MWSLRGGLGRGSFVVLYVGLVVAPLLLARVLSGPGEGFREEIGSALGIAAFGMFLVGFWLTGRFQAISARAGLDIILTFHRYAAMGALLLLIAHVLVSFGADAPSVAAWVAFIVVLAIAVMAVARPRMRLSFEAWRFSHGIGAIGVAVAGFAHATSDGAASSEPALAAFWGVMVIAAIASLVWVHPVRAARKARHPYQVVSVEKAADRTWTVALEPRDGEAIDYIAGQYAFVSFGERGYRHPGNPFSFSSAPFERPRVEFTVRENGDLTDEISQLEPGSVAYLDGPYGHLSPGNYRGPERGIEGVVLIAGGVGITPMISILKQARHRGQQQPIKLLYGARNAEDLAFTDELGQLKQALQLDVRHVVSQPPPGWAHDVGRLDEEFLARHVEAADKGHMFFVCGSTGLIDDVIEGLDKLGLATPGMVHSENFSIFD